LVFYKRRLVRFEVLTRPALELLLSNYQLREKLADALIEMGEYEEAIAQ
jgi:hypothetical protein